jgi:hypothetical protein
MSASATAARSVAPQCGARTQASSLRRARAPRSRALARASADDGASTASVRVFTGSSKEALFGAQQNMLALLEASSRDDAAILAAIDELEKLNPTPAPARHNSLLGKWRLRWSQQQESSNFFQKLFAGVASDNFQILNKDDTLENLVLLGPLTVSATAPTQAVSDSRTEVRISTVDVSVGGTRVWRKTLSRNPAAAPGGSSSCTSTTSSGSRAGTRGACSCTRGNSRERARRAGTRGGVKKTSPRSPSGEMMS